MLAELIENVDAHYFLCDLTGFMAVIQSDLERRSVPAEQIHVETFGPKQPHSRTF